MNKGVIGEFNLMTINNNFSFRVVQLSMMLLVAFMVVACKSNVEPKKNLVKEQKAEGKTLPKWLTGTWEGELFYHHIEQSLTVTLAPQKGKLKIFYPGKDCISSTKISINKNKGIDIKEVTMQGGCPKSNGIQLLPYINKTMVLNKDIAKLSDVNILYMQYPKSIDKNELLSGWLTKKRTPKEVKTKEKIEKKIIDYFILEKNQMSRPEIKEVIELYKEVEYLDANKKLRTFSNSAECYGGNVMIDGVIYKDNSNHPRKLFMKGGTGDLFGKATYYYDNLGMLRFSFITLDSVNGRQYKKRVYFNKTGKLIYTNNQFKEKSDGFPEIVKEPENKFNDLCNH